MSYIVNLRNLSKAINLTSDRLTKKSIAIECGISRVTLDNIEKGREIGLYKFLKLINLIGVDINDIIQQDAEGVQSLKILNGQIGATSEVGMLKEKIEILERLLAEKERVISLYEKMTGNVGFTNESSQ